MSRRLKTKKPVKPITKIETLIHLIKRFRGATLAELQKATGWQAHSVRGAIRLGRQIGCDAPTLQTGKTDFREPISHQHKL